MTHSALFDTPSPRVFTLPSSTGFLTALARTLSKEFPEPQALAAVTVLVPTRRAGRALAEAFAEVRGDGAPVALLPMIRPIGDVDADDPPFEPGELADIAPPPVPVARRRFELAGLILQMEAATGRSMGPGGALALADELAALIDDLATEDVTDLSALDEAVRATLPEHMRQAAVFLDILMTAWPARLAELGAVDPARRRSALLRALAQRWRDHPPEGPVIAAGSTGSIPAAAELLTCIAGLEQGLVVLPGFQPDMDDRAWDAIDEGHPQRSMKALIEQIGIDRDAVQVWPDSGEGKSAAARTRILAEALRPAEATSDWVGRVHDLKEGWGETVFEAAFEGLAIIEAPGPAEEARAIALILRETLEVPGERAVVVTPDRALARRIATEMRRFGVALDDSAGEALSDTAVGAFLMRVLDAALDPGSALALAALWSSPLLAMGEERARLRPEFGALERRVLRGRRPGYSFAELRAHIGKAMAKYPEQAGRWQALIDQAGTALAPLLTLEGLHPAASWARGLAAAAEMLAADESRSGAERLWAGDAGEAAALLIREFIEEADALPAMSGGDFARALLETARTRRVRGHYGTHPRLQILGPLEARLVSARRVVLAGLNEGVWPPRATIDPFMSRGMREAVGLSAPERRFGLAAHDFAQLAAAPTVILTRAMKADGAPTVASRWLWRLQTLARGALGDSAAARLAPETDYLALARRLDLPAASSTIEAPAPKPAVEARPRKLSVTRIETWIRDPYAVFARSILGLEKLDPLDRPPGPAERGSAYHRAVQIWVGLLGDQTRLPADALDQLLQAGRAALLDAGFTGADLGLELPRFARAAAWLVEWESGRRSDPRQSCRPVALEVYGELTIEAPGGPFTLTGIADRIDIRSDGALEIIDYKTGGVPSVREVAAGFSPQLPLEAAMAARGGFAGVPTHESGALTYVAIGGQKVPASERSAVGTDDTADALGEEALENLKAWITRFDDPKTAYPSQPRRQYVNAWGDYDHLARRKEWASAPGDGGEEGGDA